MAWTHLRLLLTDSLGPEFWLLEKPAHHRSALQVRTHRKSLCFCVVLPLCLISVNNPYTAGSKNTLSIKNKCSILKS
jgi:hypothetical protein